jgi:hypothetical protein
MAPRKRSRAPDRSASTRRTLVRVSWATVSLRPIALAALVALACTSAEPPPDPPVLAPEPGPTPIPFHVEPAPEPMPPADSLPTSSLGWVWYHDYPDELADSFSQVGTGPVAHDHRVGDRRRYTVHRVDGGIELVRDRMPEPNVKGEPVHAWARRVTTPRAIGEPVVQVTSGGTEEIVVALRVPDGYERHAFADDGSLRSSSIVHDPPEFAARDAALQLGGTSSRPTVHVRGSDHAYLDEVDPATGKPTARAEFGPTVLFDRFPWPPEDGLGQRLGHCWPIRGGGCHQVKQRGDALELRATDLAGKERWRVTLEPKGGDWYDTATVVETSERVLVVAYHGIASGANAYTIVRDRGSLRAKGSPGSIGNIGHSKYHNEVALVLGDDGLVRAFGHESSGDYLGVLDPSTGRLLGHEVWRR